MDDFNTIIDDLYERPEITAAALSRDEGTLLYSLVRLNRPKVVVEIGTHSGVSSLFLARALAENGEGHLYTFDPYIQTSSDATRKLFESAELLGWITIVELPSVPHGLNFCKENNLKIDFMFIDGDHRVEPSAADIMGFWPLMQKWSLIALHDSSTRSGWDGPDYALRAIRSAPDEKQAAGILNFLIESGVGLSVIQKTTPPRKLFHFGLIGFIAGKLDSAFG